ncbi:hypothetical protein OJ253_701 [Cryptosporidium canis]|uniref:Uncharacterized protein n=1 Tax=Cryptosporidium canis TaxID=195482 RepID=A0A9D5HVL3_9CRYT|nr:hypothetical protein OJ253_701 [Cryptosporidium canis]
MENIQLNGDLSNIENFIKLSYKQQLELVAEQEKQKLSLYADYILSCIPLNIRKLKIREILEDQGKNVILSEEEKTEILNKLNEIVSLKSFKSESTLDNNTPLGPKRAGLYRDNLRKSRVKLLPISNTCYTIVRERTEDFCLREGDENMETNSRQTREDVDREQSKIQATDSSVFKDVISSL